MKCATWWRTDGCIIGQTTNRRLLYCGTVSYYHIYNVSWLSLSSANPRVVLVNGKTTLVQKHLVPERRSRKGSGSYLCVCFCCCCCLPPPLLGRTPPLCFWTLAPPSAADALLPPTCTHAVSTDVVRKTNEKQDSRGPRQLQ